MKEDFIFGIPLVAKVRSKNWAVIEHLFSLTLRSLLAQTDADFRVILAAHDVPSAWADLAHTPRFSLIQADWTPEPQTSANDDGGRKKWLIKQAVRNAGGGLLMFVDADDWVASDLVEKTRVVMRPHHVGAVITEGLALDYASLHAMPFPLGDAFDGPFHTLCGSCTVARIIPTASEQHWLDPHSVLGSHHEWEVQARRNGLSLAKPATSGVYMVGTGENHSEHQGPFADWRRHVTHTVRGYGTKLSSGMASKFGQNMRDLTSGRYLGYTQASDSGLK
jgi:hypothetical protein